ncbi:lysophospholipid acyltransferase family protein [Mesoterricola silvestris]|uniref:1-acyl-sn-glycerol-3-phosphate acyltransferase n=1 Tax=Mesoterricola silvestris TaxID=2927979 RepID=A0AA48GS39_9BACT|nr:lysophospholipid acyltransferase family protein [Mesoterricola silvestris]BDU72992.1 1-acyl-sn-glycerol-3-phosphate acyltransferase [Mesoterricola silvestris]
MRHPAPALRLLAALGGSALASATMGWRRRPQWVLHRWARRILHRLGVEARLASPVPEGGQLWVSNHLSWLDPVVFLSLRPSGALAKAEVAAYPLIGTGARKAGLRFVVRDDPFSRAAALKTLRRDLRGGLPFLLFPEGTTTTGEALAPLREGGIRMAYRLGIPVLPFHLGGADAQYPWVGDASLLPHLRGLARARRTRVSVYPGPVLDPAAFPDEARFVAAIRSHLTRPPEGAVINPEKGS